jgi:hypothetical protein
MSWYTPSGVIKHHVLENLRFLHDFPTSPLTRWISQPTTFDASEGSFIKRRAINPWKPNIDQPVSWLLQKNTNPLVLP